MANIDVSRRHFLAGLALGTLGGCSEQHSPERYNPVDVALLNAQYAIESGLSGMGPFGVHRYTGYRGLARLPWFELNRGGQLLCVDESIPRAIDVHAHLGMSVLFEPELDLLAKTPRVKHLLNCDADPGCNLDLDVYANGNFTAETRKTLSAEIRSQGLWGSDFARTQTIPNLLDEMDRMRVEQAVLLPIKLGLWFGDNLTEQWRQQVDNAGLESRLPVGFSVNPHDPEKLAQLEHHARSGFKVLKLHPTVQRFFPDRDDMMPVYELARDLGVTVFFHGGRAGIEPEAAQPYALPRHYKAVFRNFPDLKIIVGHAGARDFLAMLDSVIKFNNVWIDCHGQSLTNLNTLIDKANAERVLFGSDWPFYHLGMSLAKVLITTDSPQRKRIRELILRDNAASLLNFA